MAFILIFLALNLLSAIRAVLAAAKYITHDTEDERKEALEDLVWAAGGVASVWAFAITVIFVKLAIKLIQ